MSYAERVKDRMHSRDTMIVDKSDKARCHYFAALVSRGKVRLVAESKQQLFYERR